MGPQACAGKEPVVGVTYPKSPRAESSDLFLSSSKPDEFALAPLGSLLALTRASVASPVGHSWRFEGIADENRREIAHHLIKAGDRLRSRRQDIRAAEN